MTGSSMHAGPARGPCPTSPTGSTRPPPTIQQAERLGSREQVLDFQAHCVVDCTEAGRWAEALWYLDRLIAARPDDAMLHEDRAAVYGKLGREADRQAELARVFELGADEGLVIPRAEELGRAGRWAEAAGLLARCGRAGPLSRELAQAWVIACLKAGDRAGYREACAAFLAGQGPDPTVVWNALAAASFFALGAEGLDDYRVPMRWFEKRLSATPRHGSRCTGISSRAPWEGCCSGPAGWTRRSSA